MFKIKEEIDFDKVEIFALLVCAFHKEPIEL